MSSMRAFRWQLFVVAPILICTLSFVADASSTMGKPPGSSAAASTIGKRPVASVAASTIGKRPVPSVAASTIGKLPVSSVAGSTIGELPGSSGAAAGAQQIPEWFLRSIEDKTRAGGVWLTDNAAYAEEDGGIEAYGLAWRAGLGGRSMIGRLYSLRGGEELATHWEFRTFWHPVERTVMVYQFGADGTVGWGPLTRGDDGTVIVDQTFAGPDGTQMRVRHESRTEGDREIGRSFNWVDGEWQPRRSYTWVLQR